MYFIDNMDRKDTLEPLGFESEPKDKGKAGDKKGAAADAKKRPPRRPRAPPAGRVIVIGAGPAGLAAASMLKVGGRVGGVGARGARSLQFPTGKGGRRVSCAWQPGSKQTLLFSAPASRRRRRRHRANPAPPRAPPNNPRQRNGAEVVVLEARDRVGGRVHSYRGPFSAPVDLGASLITGEAQPLGPAGGGALPGAVGALLRLWLSFAGAAKNGGSGVFARAAGGLEGLRTRPPTPPLPRPSVPPPPPAAGTQPEVTGSRRPDPSAIICRQLGIGLHPLQSEVLPLYDWRAGGSGAVLPNEMDAASDRWGAGGAACLARSVHFWRRLQTLAYGLGLGVWVFRDLVIRGRTAPTRAGPPPKPDPKSCPPAERKTLDPMPPTPPPG